MLAASGWIAKDANQRSQVERHIEGAFSDRHTRANHGSQLRSRCWFYRGWKIGEPREKPSKHERDQLQQLYSEFEIFWESTRSCTQVVTHPAITPVRLGLSWNLVVKGNALTASVIRVIVFNRFSRCLHHCFSSFRSLFEPISIDYNTLELNCFVFKTFYQLPFLASKGPWLADTHRQLKPFIIKLYNTGQPKDYYILLPTTVASFLTTSVVSWFFVRMRSASSPDKMIDIKLNMKGTAEIEPFYIKNTKWIK